MLTVVEYGKDVYDFPALVVLGCFDAIHLGHRELLKKAKLQAKINGLDLGVMMFKDGKNGKLIYSFEERLAILEQFNVKFVIAIDYNDEFKAIAPIDFLNSLEDKINVKAYMSGKDFRFGAGAKGKSSTLKNYAEDDDNGVWYMPIKDVVADGEKISTTLVKSLLEEGNISKANELLGSEFSLSGEVVKGYGRGTSEVGFPTVNIEYPEWKHRIKQGVYSVKSLIDGVEYQGIANFGNCPTFGDDRVALEVYFEGYSGDLYGQTLTIRFVDFIRETEQFGSAQELSEQISADLHSIDETVVADAAEEIVEEVVEEEQPVEEVTEEVIEEEQPAEEIPEEVVEEEQPVEETEEVVEEEQPVEEIAEEVVEEERPVEEIHEEVVEEEQPVEEITEGVIEEEQPVEEITEGVIEEEQPVEEITEEVVEEEQPAEEITEEVIEEEQPVEEVTEEVVEEEQLAEEIPEEVIEEEQPAEEITEEGVEEEQPVEEVSDTDGDKNE